MIPNEEELFLNFVQTSEAIYLLMLVQFKTASAFKTRTFLIGRHVWCSKSLLHDALMQPPPTFEVLSY